MKLRYELYIAASNEAKDLYKKTLPKDGFFNCDALNLNELIAKVEIDGTKIDDISGKILFKEALLLVMDDLKHFKYSIENIYPNSIDHLYGFYAKIKNNNVSLDMFAKDDKKNDIDKIFTSYENLKRKYNLLDSTDILDRVTSIQLNKVLDKYDSILIDWQFFDSGIDFFSSDKVKELFEQLSKEKNIQERKETTSEVNITLNKAFDFEDETATAIKIAKDLIKNKNIAIDDIAIVVSKIDDYKAHFERYLKEYAIRGVIGKGKSFFNSPVYHEMIKLQDNEALKKFAYKTQYKLDSLDDRFKEEYKLMVDCGLRVASNTLALMQKFHHTFDIKVKYNELFLLLSSSANYQSLNKLAKLKIIEHNQVLKTKFKHIIYIGIDSTHLPQKFNDNFLYNSLNANKLHISNYYKDAMYIYETLKKNTSNLHLVSANYNEKRELQISSVISDNFIAELKPYQIDKNTNSLNDLLNIGLQTTVGDKVKTYIKSQQVNKEDEFHGVLGDAYKDANENKSIVFSASRLNNFSDCPLKYYFNYILKATSPSEFNDEEFDSAQAGTLFHSVAEEFAILYKKNNSIDVEIKVQEVFESEYKKALPTRDGKVFETVFHKQKKQVLQVAIDRFKKYVISAGLDNFDSAERKFDFEMDGNKFTGIIDRIDIDKDLNEVTLIDYKTSSIQSNTGSKDKKYEKLVEFKEFQLPLYQFFVDQDEEYKKYEASESYLLTFSGNISATNIKNGVLNARFGQTSSSIEDEENKIFLLDDESKNRYKNEINKIANSINDGNFYFNSSEESCQYCTYKTICKDGVKSKKKW